MKLTIKKKLLGGFGLVLVLMLAMSLVAFFMGNRVEEANEEAIDMMEMIVFAVERETDHLDWLNELGDVFILGRDFTGELDYSQCAFGSWYYDLLDSGDYEAVSPRFREIFLEINEPHRLLHESADEIMTIFDRYGYEAGFDEALEIYENETQLHMATVRNLINDMIEELDRVRDESIEFAQVQGNLSNLVLLIASLIALTIGIILALVISRGITNPVNNVVDFLNELAEEGGDLTRRIEVKSNDEIGDLANSFNKMVENLRGIISSVKQSAEETADTSQELASGTEETNASIQQVAASVTEFASTTQELSSNAQLMAEGTDEVSNLAANGLEKMEETEKRMQEIISTSESAGMTIEELNKASEEINNITSVISNVADQTNLLALNAAIEAARAGEHGQGFAVVADEVRELAEETQKSVADIQTIINRFSENTTEAVNVINNNNQQISDGAEILRETGTSFNEIVEKIKQVASLVENVASSSQELSASGEEVSAATEEQTASMEEISSAIEELSGMAEELNTLVGEMKT